MENCDLRLISFRKVKTWLIWFLEREYLFKELVIFDNTI